MTPASTTQTRASQRPTGKVTPSSPAVPGATGTPATPGTSGPGAAAEQSTPVEPPPTPTPAIRQRRRPTLVVLGATLAALGGLGGAYLAQRGGTAQNVLVAATTLQPGHKIALADLRTVQIGTVDGANTLPESAKASIIGKTVRSAVAPGTVINPSTIVTTIAPGPGSSIIGVAVKQGQMPALGLQAGDHVHLVVSASGSNANAASPEGASTPPVTTPGSTWAGYVAAISDPSRDGTRTVDVVLPSDQALQAATASGTGALTVVLDPPAGK